MVLDATYISAKKQGASMKPSKHKMTVLSQIFKLIPRNLIPKLANEFGIDRQSRVFSPTSHVLALVFGQLTHALGLNDICDTLRNHCGLVSKIRDCVPPSRNGLSHANRNRDAGMAEKLFWEVLAHLNEISPNFRIQGRRYCALPRRFKRMIHVVDSTTIQLIANCLDWAKHRRRKAAAKMHLRLDLRSFLPNFILVKTAGTHDSAEAPALCEGINEGEIVIFDKAYVDFKHLWRLFQRGVFWITRAKDNMKYDVVGQHSAPKLNILRDVVIKLTGQRTSVWYPETLRLIEAIVEIDGKPKRMTFITDNFTWAASSICDLYKARWAIEVFFKEIKQTLQLSDFISLATTRTRCAGKYGRLFSHMFYSALLRGRMNGSIPLQDYSQPCAESSGAVWIWEASSNAVGQQVIQSACEELRNRHIYLDSLHYNPTQRKGKTGNG